MLFSLSSQKAPIKSAVTVLDFGIALSWSTLDLGDYDFAHADANKESIVEKWNDLTVG